jgi:hypothetical protein
MSNQFLPNQGAPFTATSITLGDSSKVQSMCAVLPFISNYEDQGAGTTYTGYALRGSSNATASWFIMKSVTSAGITTVRFASAPFTMDQIWDNRVGLVYS